MQGPVMVPKGTTSELDLAPNFTGRFGCAVLVARLQLLLEAQTPRGWGVCECLNTAQPAF